MNDLSSIRFRRIFSSLLKLIWPITALFFTILVTTGPVHAQVCVNGTVVERDEWRTSLSSNPTDEVVTYNEHWPLHPELSPGANNPGRPLNYQLVTKTVKQGKGSTPEEACANLEVLSTEFPPPPSGWVYRGQFECSQFADFPFIFEAKGIPGEFVSGCYFFGRSSQTSPFSIQACWIPNGASDLADYTVLSTGLDPDPALLQKDVVQDCVCDPGYEKDILSGECVSTCPADQIPEPDGTCACPAGTTEGPNGECIAECPASQIPQPDGTCACPEGYTKDAAGQCVFEEELELGDCCEEGLCPTVGNPIHAGTGNKFQRENDFNLASGLTFIRYYNSRVGKSRDSSTVGINWNHSYDTRIENSLDESVVIARRADGKSISFRQDNGVWSSASSTDLKLTETNDGWILELQNGAIETYDTSGRILNIRSLGGQETTLNYDVSVPDGGDDNPETLDKVVGPFGSLLGLELGFQYNNNGRLARITIPGTTGYDYSYDAVGNLISVTYPGNVSRQYHYEDSRFPHALTGITRENGQRYANFSYDDEGRAISSDHGNGVDEVTLTYNDDGTTTVATSNGGLSTYRFETVNNKLKVNAIEGDGCASCGNSSNVTYDSNGFLASSTDGNGNVTQYVRDETGLELSRTEAAGTTQERTITTEWDQTLRVPIRITSPQKVIEFTYDVSGNLLSQTESARN